MKKNTNGLNLLFVIGILLISLLISSYEAQAVITPTPAAVKVASSLDHNMVIMKDGTLWAWGNNKYGQLGDGTWVDKTSPVPIGTDNNWKSIAAGQKHSVAIKTDGTLWAWGANPHGERGDGSSQSLNKNTPVQIGTDNNWRSIAAGHQHTLAIKFDGSLWGWGDNYYGQLGNGLIYTYAGVPIRIGTDNNWSSISASFAHSVAIKTDGTLWAWGLNEYGQLGDGTSVYKTTPVQIGLDTNWRTVAAGANFTIAIKTEGTLWAWGGNGYGQLGDGTILGKLNPVHIGTDVNWISIVAGYYSSYAIKTDGTLWAWGSDSVGQLGDGRIAPYKSNPIQIGADTNWNDIASGFGHAVAINNGKIWTWGQNMYSNLGNGIPADKNMPVQIGTNTNWLSIGPGGTIANNWLLHTAAVQADGTIWAWGNNDVGQLGYRNSDVGQLDEGGRLWQKIPFQIGTDANWESVRSGGAHTMAIKTNGTLWAWGGNWYGQLGDGTVLDKTIPVQVGIETDWQIISAGLSHSLAIKTDNTLWAWGWNQYGQLGDGTKGDKATPAQVGTDKNWKSISAYSYAHTVALKTNGSLWAWGSSQYGQVGNNMYGDNISPVQIGIDTNWQNVATGFFHTVAVKTDGSLWAWGSNDSGQLGIGNWNNKGTPVRVGTDNNWMNVTAGGYHTVAVKTDGSLWAWGSNGYGELGIGLTGGNIIVPVQVGNDKNWMRIAAGYNHTMAIKNDGTLWAWGYNVNGQLGDGTAWSEIPIQITEPPDITPPDTFILPASLPGNPTNNPRADFMFYSDDTTDPGLKFECQMDAGGYSICTSPMTYSGLTEGLYTFSVRATDLAGTTDPSPASYTWVIDTTAPETTITSQPLNPSNSSSASFSFISTESGSTFECQMDAGGYSLCISPMGYTGLMEGSHTFSVKATDLAGNTDPSPASYAWVIANIDIIPPANISPLNKGQVTSTSIMLNWTAPGDDGSIGTATSYDIRYSISAIIDETTWGNATQVIGDPIPLIAGTPQSFTVIGLDCNKNYYFAIKTSDEVPNTSGISSVLNQSTKFCDFGDQITTEPGTPKIIVGNGTGGAVGEVTITYKDIPNTGTTIVLKLNLNKNSLPTEAGMFRVMNVGKVYDISLQGTTPGTDPNNKIAEVCLPKPNNYNPTIHNILHGIDMNLEWGWETLTTYVDFTGNFICAETESF